MLCPNTAQATVLASLDKVSRGAGTPLARWAMPFSSAFVPALFSELINDGDFRQNKEYGKLDPGGRPHPFYLATPQEAQNSQLHAWRVTGFFEIIFAPAATLPQSTRHRLPRR
jgi:hypothetical protein